MFEPIDDIEWTADHRARTRDRLTRQVEKDTRRRRRNPWIFIVPSLVLVGAVVTGALALLLPVTNQNVVHCFARAEIRDDGSYPGGGVAFGNAGSDVIVAIEDAIAACTLLWQDGMLDPADEDGATGGNGTPPPPPNPDRNSPVPPELTVCVMRDGTAAVVPGDEEVCTRLGLARPLEG
ncbi:hypothetical protein ACFFGH_10660 [Lysobacter korlensis]|uniref:Uncharacterized protein n=1 Tax=Lysobacter korlensis TaxID=553636 RepID=A0ABV6RNC2_9GAMM